LVREDVRRARSLAVLRGVLTDESGVALLDLLEALSHEAEPTRIGAVYGRLFNLLAGEAEMYPEPLIGDAWQNHLLDRLLLDENAFSTKARLGGAESLGAALKAQVRRDLAALQALFQLDARRLAMAACHAAGDDQAGPWVHWDAFAPRERGTPIHGARGRELKEKLGASRDWPSLVGELATYFGHVGAGPFGRFVAFRWVRDGGLGEPGHLEGIAEPDPIRLDQLVGYDRERALVIQNTRHMLAGYSANSVLLYGDRGTGKSSTVKALLNEYSDQGLRLIEVAKDDLADFPRIAALLRGRPEKFILFIDDLSFDEHERDYRGLKALLEGGIESRPPNVVLYATSNRRHLVQERWTDRETALNAELHGQDTMQEKLSLSDRFGIRAVFPSPDQTRYLQVVEALAGQRGLQIDPETLRRRGLQWAEWHNGRSGRTARQFVDFLEGELGLQQR
jgi:hypothetical protein